MVTILLQNNRQTGMTLVELVMIIGISLMLLAVITTSVVNLYQINGYNIAQSYEIDNARRGLQDWLGDVREMSYGDDGTFPIALMEDHQIGFYSDVDDEPSVEYVEYEHIGTNLFKRTYKGTGNPIVYNFLTPVKTELLSEYVQNLNQALATFQYYDTDGTLLDPALSPLTDVRYIEVQVIVNIDPVRSPGEFLLKSGVSPRNLKDNL
jgi:type II secretory pathway pseudopilin PulG